ncbi:hypothetical protein BH09SUM1_BH09SUM1_30830 [soil metagenome]
MKSSPRRRYGWSLSVGGLAVLLFIYALAALFSTDDLLKSWETTVYRTFDATLFVAPAWDWTVLFFASVWWIVISAVVLFLIIVQANWKTRREHFGRSYGFFLATIAFMIISASLMDILAEDMRRAAPWTALYIHRHALEQPRDVHFIHFARHTDVLEEVTYGWTFLTLVLGMRFRRVAIYSGIGLFLYVLGNITIGRQWPTTLLVSAALGFITAGIWTAGWSRPLSWVERKAEEVFVRLFWRHLQVAAPALGAVGAPAPLHAGAMLREARARASRKQGYWADVVESEVIPLISPGNRDYEIIQHPPTVDGKKSSPSSFVRFVKIRGGRTYVVKSVQRKNSVMGMPGRIAKYVRSSRTSKVMQSLGLPVPEILWASESLRAFGMRRRFVAVEEYIEGRPIDLHSETELRETFALLARLHEVTGEGWGTLGEDRSTAFGSYMYRFAQQELSFHLHRLMERQTILIEEVEIDEIWRRMESRLMQRQATKLPFRLIHGDITEKNILRTTEGKFYLIDFVDVGFDLAAREIVKAGLYLCRALPGARSDCFTGYFAARGAGAWEEFRVEAPFAFFLYALRELTQGRVAVPQIDDAATRSRALLQWIHRASDVGESAWGATPAETNWALIDQLFAGVELPTGDAQGAPIGASAYKLSGNR